MVWTVLDIFFDVIVLSGMATAEEDYGQRGKET
jgi:hypothetical protein